MSKPAGSRRERNSTCSRVLSKPQMDVVSDFSHRRRLSLFDFDFAQGQQYG
jgi:hypothetical protein